MLERLGCVMDETMQVHFTDNGTGPTFRLWLCGVFRVERRTTAGYEALRTAEWGGSSYPRLLLKALMCSPGRQARREALMDMLWPESDPEQAAQYLNTATTKLRRVLRPLKGHASLLATESDSTVYRLAEQDQLWVDADEALALVKRAELLGRTSAEALYPLQQAVTSFLRGSFLQEEEGLWVTGRRATVEQVRYRSRLWLAEAYEHQGLPGQAELVLNQLLEEDPFDEDILCRLMELLQQQGMIHQGLRLYEQAAQRYAQEGIELSASIQHAAAHLAETRHSRRATANDRQPVLLPALVSDFKVVSPSHEQSQHVIQLTQIQQEAEGEKTAPAFLLDQVLRSGSLLFHILELVRRWTGNRDLLGLQQRVSQEIQDYDRMKHPSDKMQERHSRREALAMIVGLPLILQEVMLAEGHPVIPEEFLSQCAASIAACAHLMNGTAFAFLDSVVTAYLPTLEKLVREESTYRQTAATLASQSYQLKSLLALHRNDLKQQITYSKQGIFYAQAASHTPLLITALIRQAMTFYYSEAPMQFLETYLQVEQYIREVSLPLQSKICIMLAVGYAQTGEKAQAERYFGQAQDLFSQQTPTGLTTPSVEMPTVISLSELTLWGGVMRLELHQPEAAWKTLSSVNKFEQSSTIPERMRVEIMNRMAEAAIGMQEMELFCHSIEQGRQGAIKLGSERRWQEAYAIYHQGKGVWPREAAVKNLAKLFVR